MTTPDIAAAMATAMNTENRRRELASATPGLGAPVSLPDVPYHSQGLGPVVGENHQTTAAIADAVSKAYGPRRPGYGHSLTGGLDYAPWMPARRCAAACTSSPIRCSRRRTRGPGTRTR